MVQCIFKQFRRARAFEKDPLEVNNRYYNSINNNSESIHDIKVKFFVYLSLSFVMFDYTRVIAIRQNVVKIIDVF